LRDERDGAKPCDIWIREVEEVAREVARDDRVFGLVAVEMLLAKAHEAQP
jgi:hypothetical protein